MINPAKSPPMVRNTQVKPHLSFFEAINTINRLLFEARVEGISKAASPLWVETKETLAQFSRIIPFQDENERKHSFLSFQKMLDEVKNDLLYQAGKIAKRYPKISFEDERLHKMLQNSIAYQVLYATNAYFKACNRELQSSDEIRVDANAALIKRTDDYLERIKTLQAKSSHNLKHAIGEVLTKLRTVIIPAACATGMYMAGFMAGIVLGSIAFAPLGTLIGMKIDKKIDARQKNKMLHAEHPKTLYPKGSTLKHLFWQKDHLTKAAIETAEEVKATFKQPRK